MIVKIIGNSASFVDTTRYAEHDPHAKSKERVAWTHTRNLASSDVSDAALEMEATAANAEELKRSAGIRAGGRPLENPVKHLMLAWDQADNPSKSHMLKTSEHFLQHMGWNEHQAVIIAHDDKAYAHVHIILNRVHPETGRGLNEGFEQRRAQQWALQYEQENGMRCEKRTLSPEDRPQCMPRNMWMQFRKSEQEFAKSENQLKQRAENLADGPEDRKKSEWRNLFDLQRLELKEFYAEGKQQFKEVRSEIYQEIRHEFRARWADYYKSEKVGTAEDKSLRDAVKATLLADQKAALEPRRDAACKSLMERREAELSELLDYQKSVRKEFGWRLDLGLDTAAIVNDMKPPERVNADKAAFRAAAQETTFAPKLPETSPSRDAEADAGQAVSSSPPDRLAGAVGRRATSFAIGILDSLFRGLTGEAAAVHEPRKADRDDYAVAAEEATKKMEHQQRETHDEEWRQRSKADYAE